MFMIRQRLISTICKVMVLAVIFPLSWSVSADDEKLIVDGDLSWTAVSGYTGDYKDIGNSKGNTRIIYGITWYEQGDDPCQTIAKTKHLNNNSNREYGVKVGHCDTPGNGKTVKFYSDPDMVYKIQVCTTDKNKTQKNKLKGIRIWARSREVNGSSLVLTNQSSYQESKHTNCKKWHKAVSCPAGKAATKIRAHSGTNNGHSYSGIALGCESVVFKN